MCEISHSLHPESGKRPLKVRNEEKNSGSIRKIRENAGFTRDNIVNHLEVSGIQTRMLFAGNLIKHPCFDEMRRDGRGYKINVGRVPNILYMPTCKPDPR